MQQQERLRYLVQFLLAEDAQYDGIQPPETEAELKKWYRALQNMRPPRPIAAEFLQVQDKYLQEEKQKKHITTLAELQPMANGFFLWRGDITTLQVDAIVNAANSALLGCFCPGHGCIDNAIHTAAGVQLRLACWDIMTRQKQEEAPGQAKLTPGFQLPCRYVLHTVGPMVLKEPSAEDKRLLQSCYWSCLQLAEKNHCASIAFCCISTGEYHFPQALAAQIAVDTVKNYLEMKQTQMEVVFNVFTTEDEIIYQKRLAAN